MDHWTLEYMFEEKALKNCAILPSIPGKKIMSKHFLKDQGAKADKVYS